MPKYKCINHTCSMYGKESLSNSKTKWVRDVLVDTGKPCPICGLDRELIPSEGMTTAITGSENICKR